MEAPRISRKRPALEPEPFWEQMEGEGGSSSSSQSVPRLSGEDVDAPGRSGVDSDTRIDVEGDLLLSFMTGDSQIDAKGPVCEVCSSPRVSPFAPKEGLKEWWSLDLTTEHAQRRPWDFDNLDCRARAKKEDEASPSGRFLFLHVVLIVYAV